MDSGASARLTLAGSSAKLLSREIATGLRGGALQTEIFTYSFMEFAVLQGVEIQVAPFSVPVCVRTTERRSTPTYGKTAFRRYRESYPTPSIGRFYRIT